MTKREGLTPDRLRDLLDYFPETGLFVWRVARSHVAKGDIAGHLDRDGYVTIRVDGVTHEASRLAWLYVYNEWPLPSVDHINRQKADNRIVNLRIATKQQNGVNRGAQKNSISGIKGVTPHGSGWRAKITVNDKPYSLGTYRTKNEAHVAYTIAEKRFFGEFSEAEGTGV